MTDWKQQNVDQWAHIVSYLGQVEEFAGQAPLVGAVDEDQRGDTADAIRAARLAVAALLGEYVTDSYANPVPQPASERPGSSRGHNPAVRPGDHLHQQPDRAQQQAQQPGQQAQQPAYEWGRS